MFMLEAFKLTFTLQTYALCHYLTFSFEVKLTSSKENPEANKQRMHTNVAVNATVTWLSVTFQIDQHLT